MLGAFVDTIIVCSCTAFILLLSDVHTTTELTGVQLTQAAIVSHVGAWGADFLAVLLFLFAFSSVIGNYAYAESNVQFYQKPLDDSVVFRMVCAGQWSICAVNSVPLVWIWLICRWA